MTTRTGGGAQTLAPVRDATAFDMVVEGPLGTTAMPPAAELALLRTKVDVRRTLQKKCP